MNESDFTPNDQALPADDMPAATPYLRASDVAVSLSDPSRVDNPLVWVNDAFVTLTGYPAAQCIGRNCRFLQGAMTRKTDVRSISNTLANNRVERTELLNYRANGQPFHNAVFVGPVRAANGSVKQFFGLQWDITTSDRRAGATPEFGSVISSYRQRLTMRRSLSLELKDLIVKRSSILNGPELGYSVIERLAATVRPEQYPLIGDIEGLTPVRSMLDFMFLPYTSATPAKVSMTGEDTTLMTPDLAGALALVFHEIGMQAMLDGGLSSDSSEFHVEWLEDDAPDRSMIEIQLTESVSRNVLARTEGNTASPQMSELLVRDALERVHGTVETSLDADERRTIIRIPRDHLPAAR